MLSVESGDGVALALAVGAGAGAAAAAAAAAVVRLGSWVILLWLVVLVTAKSEMLKLVH
jgi:hypothetical protein